jgi:zinc transport system ATP-binding protein
MDRAPAESLIEASQLKVVLGGNSVIDNVSLTVRRGEIVVLIGPNGSGKTTLLRALLGLVSSQGEIRRAPHLRVGYVPQQFPRDPSLPLSVARFVATTGASQARGDAALHRVGASSLAGKQVATLSGGELARVLLARAIARMPDLLILDEPLAGVDVAGEAELYHLIAELRDELACGVVLVSHDLHVVMAQASRVICINRHICCEGAADAVIRDPEFVRLFGARAASELALYTHVHDHTHRPSGEIAPREHAHG